MKEEDNRNNLYIEIKKLLSVIDIIDNLDIDYELPDFENMSEFEFLNEQIKLIIDARLRLMKILDK